MAGGNRRRVGGPGRFWINSGGQSGIRLHHQSRDPLRIDLVVGPLVDDPIVDVENIARHFHQKGRASMQIVMDAVAEIRPPLISATLAVIVSFIPMFFITGMMGPYMSPMALNRADRHVDVDGSGFYDHALVGYHVLKGADWSQGKGKGDRSSTSDTTGQSPFIASRPIRSRGTQEESTLSIL